MNLKQNRKFKVKLRKSSNKLEVIDWIDFREEYYCEGSLTVILKKGTVTRARPTNLWACYI